MVPDYQHIPYGKSEAMSDPDAGRRRTGLRARLLSFFGIDYQCNLRERIMEHYCAIGLWGLVKFSTYKAFTPLHRLRRSFSVAARRAWFCGPFARPGTFIFDGHTYQCLYHPYNRTYENERAVEVPLIHSVVKACGGGRILELGNVLAHYVPIEHTVVDKYEVAPGVINEDIVDFRTADRYDLIVSISTLEHVGWDEEPQDATKPLTAFRRLVNLLAPGGELWLTVPLGQNPHLDKMLKTHVLPFEKVWFLRQRERGGEWQQVDRDEVTWAYPGNLLIGLYRAPARSDVQLDG